MGAVWRRARSANQRPANSYFGVVIEWVGARAVLGFGAAFAIFLAYWVDLRHLQRNAFLPESEGGEKYTPVNASRLI